MLEAFKLLMTTNPALVMDRSEWAARFVETMKKMVEQAELDFIKGGTAQSC